MWVEGALVVVKLFSAAKGSQAAVRVGWRQLLVAWERIWVTLPAGLAALNCALSVIWLPAVPPAALRPPSICTEPVTG